MVAGHPAQPIRLLTTVNVFGIALVLLAGAGLILAVAYPRDVGR